MITKFHCYLLRSTPFPPNHSSELIRRFTYISNSPFPLYALSLSNKKENNNLNRPLSKNARHVTFGGWMISQARQAGLSVSHLQPIVPITAGSTEAVPPTCTGPPAHQMVPLPLPPSNSTRVPLAKVRRQTEALVPVREGDTVACC